MNPAIPLLLARAASSSEDFGAVALDFSLGQVTLRRLLVWIVSTCAFLASWGSFTYLLRQSAHGSADARTIGSAVFAFIITALLALVAYIVSLALRD